MPSAARPVGLQQASSTVAERARGTSGTDDATPTLTAALLPASAAAADAAAVARNAPHP